MTARKGDKYKYFRIEAAELVESVLIILNKNEYDESSKDSERELLRLFHTIKGAARVVGLEEIAKLAHESEQGLIELSEENNSLSQDLVLKLKESILKINSLVPGTEKEQIRILHKDKEDGLFFDSHRDLTRVQISDLDSMVEGISHQNFFSKQVLSKFLQMKKMELELSSYLADSAASKEWLQSFSKTMRDAEEAVNICIKSSDRIKKEVESIRLTPFYEILNDLKSAAVKIGAEEGKKIEFQVEGDNCRADPRILYQLRLILTNLIRNSIVHGIETPEMRTQVGKSEVGQVELRIENRGFRLKVVYKDDGQGIDIEKIKQKLMESGFIDKQKQNHTDEEILEGLLLNGVSTVSEVNDLAGRGVGLESIHRVVKDLGGDISLTSVIGKGMELSIHLPVSMSHIRAIRLLSEKYDIYFPMEFMKGVFAIDESELTHGSQGPLVPWGKAMIPYYRLEDLVNGTTSAIQGPGARKAVVASYDQNLLAIGVEKCGTLEDIILQEIPDYVNHAELFSGVTLNEEMLALPVISMKQLFAKTPSSYKMSIGQLKQKDSKILVIDDSLTTRMLEKNILESAGLSVDMAASGEEALEMASRVDYALFIVDVDMPGMSGLEFIEAIRAKPHLAHTPAVIVSSRSSSDDRKKGIQVGANDYLMKSEFNQERLVGLVKRYVT